MAELGYGGDAASGLRNRVRANLRYLEKGRRMLKEASGPGAMWRLAERRGRLLLPAFQHNPESRKKDHTTEKRADIGRA